MDAKHTLSITEARKRIFDIADDVQKPGAYYVLTEKGRPKAVVLSAEEYDGLIETLEVYHQFPNIEEDIKRAEKDYEEEKTISLEELLAEHGLVVQDKGKTPYVASRRRSQRKKRSGQNR